MSKTRGWNPTGFFPTPHSVVEMMVRMTLQEQAKDGQEPRTRSVCDPAVGSGRMLLHASNLTLNLWGQDIDPMAVTMCKINGALYAPWLSFPLPASILGTTVEASPLARSVSEASGAILPLFRVDDRAQGLLFEP
jgi:N-6 DNA Methylase